ncbi:MAG: NAD(P)-dependent oxidoreductase [Anaerolineae bacterium]|nr:NAD(P)-dependent oxidoreductase [Anaerolineae bacterium]
MQRIALLGLGIMGSGIGANLLKNGFPLTVYNRTPEKAKALVEQGATLASTPREAAQNADVVISVVGDDVASRSVWMGDDGALAGAAQGTILIECSTLSPDWVRDLAESATAQGCPFLDAPMTGSREAAANAQLVLIIGGEADALEKVRPALEAISQTIVHMGGTGTGATWKLINNMMTAVHIAALAEGLTLAEKAGLNMQQVAKLIPTSATSSPSVKGKMPRMLEHRYGDTDFSLRWMQKDVNYALELGETFDVPLKTVNGAWAIFQAAREQGLLDVDFAAVIEALRK